MEQFGFDFNNPRQRNGVLISIFVTVILYYLTSSMHEQQTNLKNSQISQFLQNMDKQMLNQLVQDPATIWKWRNGIWDDQEFDNSSADLPQKFSTPCNAMVQPNRAKYEEFSNQPLSIAIVTLLKTDELLEVVRFGKKKKEVFEKSIQNKMQYSSFHRYPLFYYHNNLIDPDRPVQWSKLKIVQFYLNFFDWVLWVDLDAFFTNFEITIEDIIAKSAAEGKRIGKEYHFIAAADWNGLNSGVFLIKNSEWGRKLLEDAWKSYQDIRIKKSKFFEQEALKLLINSIENARYVHMVTQKTLNAYPTGVLAERLVREGSIEHQSWVHQKGDFILHCPGMHEHEVSKVIDGLDWSLTCETNVQLHHGDWVFAMKQIK